MHISHIRFFHVNIENPLAMAAKMKRSERQNDSQVEIPSVMSSASKVNLGSSPGV